ncbi:hypothetical protein [Thermococcus sp. Bubb.Bath]|uniref:hypothetical protein n=1 Tax=Thermococcus sp. Bubb.Bath TaxID=1638242 RepID=UPI00143A26B9|nr:hypothetical protein [Thermococcus sp. Bubb.Bath]NJF25255.1 hypothetical protein [Thermococcus sp. Bubb.Bath]
MMRMMSLKKIGAALLVLFLFGISVNYFFTKVAADNFNEVTVTYSKSPLSGFIVNKAERFAVHFGKGYGTFTTVGMLPNGTPVFLGFYGGNGMFRMNFKALLKYSKIWNDYMVRMGIDPESVNPGILFLGTVQKDNHLYSTAFSVPIRVDRILEGYSTKVEASPLMMKLPDSYLNLSKPQKGNGTVSADSIWDDDFYEYENEQTEKDERFIMSLVPNRFNEQCYGNGLLCMYWKPEGILPGSYGINASIPIVVMHFWGEKSGYESGHLELFMVTHSESGVSISFSTLGVENTGTSVTQVSAGSIFALKGEREWIERYPDFGAGNLSSDGCYVMGGIVGHYAVIRFRLIKDGKDDEGHRWLMPTDTRAFFTIVVPTFEKTYGGAELKGWSGIFNEDNGSELLKKFGEETSNLDEYKHYVFTGNFHLTNWGIHTSSQYSPLFSVGVSVDDLGALPVAGFAIGMSENDSNVFKVGVHFTHSYPVHRRFDITVYKMKGMFLYMRDNRSYIVPVTYFEVHESPGTTTFPVDPHHRFYPVRGNSTER